MQIILAPHMAHLKACKVSCLLDMYISFRLIGVETT